MRGTFKPFEARPQRSLALFRSDLYDDIAFVSSPTQGRAFFANIGQTRRQGLDAELQLKTGRWLAYVSYSYIDATYQSGFVEASGANPAADANGNITVHPGNHLPGIPAHQVKLGAYYNVTDKWMVGATAIFTSGAYLYGDEANLTASARHPYALLAASARAIASCPISRFSPGARTSPTRRIRPTVRFRRPGQWCLPRHPVPQIRAATARPPRSLSMAACG